MMKAAPNSLYLTRDTSHVLLAANNDAIFRRLANVAGHPEWADDERYATQLARSKQVDEMLGLGAERIAELKAAGVVRV